MEFWIGYFVFTFLSLLLLNTMTSLLYRIPRNVPISAIFQKPRCGGCPMMLKLSDFFPLYRFIFVSRLCRCAKYKIPNIYHFIELFGAVLCSFIYFLWYDSDLLIAKLFLSVILFTCVIMYFEYKEIYDNMLWILLCTGLFYLFYNRECDVIQNVLYVYFGYILMHICEKKFGINDYKDTRFALILFFVSSSFEILLNLPVFIVSFAIFRKKEKKYLANIINGCFFIINNIFISKYAHF